MSSESDDIEGLLSSDSFESIEVKLSILNSTTRMEFKTDPAPKFTEITDGGMVLEAAQRSCAEGHSLLVEAKATAPGGKSASINATVRVDSVEASKAGTERITVSLVQFGEDQWQQFRAIFSSRQDDINRFLAAARGYE